MEKTKQRIVKRRRGNKRKAPQIQLSKNMNLYNPSAGTVANILYPTTIFAYSGSTNYTFQNGSDIRYLSFGTVLSNTFPFSKYASIYSEFKIQSASVIVCPKYIGPGSNSVLELGMLYVTADPEEDAPANPDNNTITGTQGAHMFSAKALSPTSVTYSFPGIGNKVNTWIQTDEPPLGVFYIGSHFTNSVASSESVFDCSFSLNVSFRNVKVH